MNFADNFMSYYRIFSVSKKKKPFFCHQMNDNVCPCIPDLAIDYSIIFMNHERFCLYRR